MFRSPSERRIMIGRVLVPAYVVRPAYEDQRAPVAVRKSAGPARRAAQVSGKPLILRPVRRCRAPVS
jgi:hypothetical protein